MINAAVDPCYCMPSLDIAWAMTRCEKHAESEVHVIRLCSRASSLLPIKANSRQSERGFSFFSSRMLTCITHSRLSGVYTFAACFVVYDELQARGRSCTCRPPPFCQVAVRTPLGLLGTDCQALHIDICNVIGFGLQISFGQNGIHPPPRIEARE